jgi:hypothetical protein
MLLTAITFVITEMTPRWYNLLWVKRKIRKLYKNLSRMKLLVLLIEYWNADKWKGTPTAFKGGIAVQTETQATTQYFTPEQNGMLKSKTREQGSLTIVLRFAREPEDKPHTRASRRRPSESSQLGTIPETTTQQSPQCTQSCVT